MMIRKITAALALSAVFAAPAMAHHPSPAEPDIGDMMGMHDAAIESMLDQRSDASLEAMADIERGGNGVDMIGGTASGGSDTGGSRQ